MNDVITEDELHRLLNKYSCEKDYHIEFVCHDDVSSGDYFTNHITHIIIALNNLKASRDQINEAVERYVKLLNPPRIYPPSDLTVPELKGQGVEYHVIRKYYENISRECNHDCNTVLQKAFPGLYKGMIGSVMHPLIFIGLGLKTRSQSLLCEGLTYMHFSFLPKTELAGKSENLFTGTLSLYEVFDEIRRDTKLLENVKKLALQKKRLRSPRSRIFKVLYKEEVEKLDLFAYKLKLPFEFSSLDEIRKSTDVLFDTVVDVYYAAEHVNEFFLLHAVTSCFALKHILNALTNYEIALDCIRRYVVCLLCFFISEGCPNFDLKRLDIAEHENMEEAWEKLRVLTISEPTRDEHVTKLVWVLKEMASRSPCPIKIHKYYLAAKSALENEFTDTLIVDVTYD